MDESKLINLYLRTLEEEQKAYSPREWFKTFLGNKHRFFDGTEKLLELLKGREIIKSNQTKFNCLRKSLSFLVRFGVELFIIKKNERFDLANSKILKQVNIVKTFTFDHSFKTEFFTDNLLGDLHLYLKAEGRNVVLIHEHLGKFSTINSKHIQNIRLINLFTFLSWADYFSQFFLLFKNLFYSTPRSENSIKNFIRLNFNEEKISPQYYLHDIHYRSFLGMIQFYDLEKIYSTFENNAWEKMMIFARNDSQSKAKIISHQHVPVAPSALNYYLTNSEIQSLPDTIVTTGKVVKDLFLSRHYPENILKAGCPLRLTLSQYPLPEKENHLALVALDGTPKASVVLNTILNNIDIFKKLKWKFIIRFHPAMGLELMRPYLCDDLEKYPMFEVSKSPLVEDIKNSSCVFYWGSTVAFEAMYSGRIVVQISGDEILSNDPITLEGGLHFVAKNLKETMDIIKNLSEEDLKQRRLISSLYCQEYFGELNASNLKSFN